jgi:hypothetical protein
MHTAANWRSPETCEGCIAGEPLLCPSATAIAMPLDCSAAQAVYGRYNKKQPSMRESASARRGHIEAGQNPVSLVVGRSMGSTGGAARQAHASTCTAASVEAGSLGQTGVHSEWPSLLVRSRQSCTSRPVDEHQQKVPGGRWLTCAALQESRHVLVTAGAQPVLCCAVLRLAASCLLSNVHTLQLAQRMQQRLAAHVIRV